MSKEYKYWRRNGIAARDHAQWNDADGLDDYSLLLELKEGDAIIELARWDGLVAYAPASLNPDHTCPDGDVIDANAFDFFFDPITDEEELGILFLQLASE